LYLEIIIEVKRKVGEGGIGKLSDGRGEKLVMKKERETK